MKSKSNFFSRLSTLDKIVLGVIALLAVVTVILNILDGAGLKLSNASLMLYLPIVALVALVVWGGTALIRRINGKVTKIVVGSCAVMVLMIALMVGFTYLSLVTYTALPHAYKTLSDPSGKHTLLVLWQFDADSQRNEESIQQRKDARRALYPETTEETIADDVTVAFEAYPTVLGGLFYRSNADAEGRVYLAYTGNVAPMNSLESALPTPAPTEAAATTAAPAETEAPVETAAPAETAAAAATAEAAPVELIDTPHGTMMLEWLDDDTTAHFYVKDPGTAEGGEYTLRLGK